MTKGNHETTLHPYFYNNRKTLYPNSYIHSRRLDTNEAQRIVSTNPDFEYLNDSGTSFKGIKIWGTPWVRKCGVWAYMLDDDAHAHKVFAQIPSDTDILLSHSPTFGLLDIYNKRKFVFDEETNSTVKKRVPANLGCPILGEYVQKLVPKLHVFGHVHESYGWNHYQTGGTLSVNASSCTIDYSPDNKPILVNYYLNK